MKQLILLIPLLFLCPHLLYSQNNQGYYKGYVLDSLNQKSLANVHIINQRTEKGTITNNTGYFEIIANTSDTLILHHVSYKIKSFTLANSTFSNTDTTYLFPESYTIKEVVLINKSWQQFKLEFVQKEFKNEQSSGITMQGLKQYKGAPIGFKPSLASAVTNPITFFHHYLNKKSVQNRKTKRYQRIIKKSGYIND